MRGGFFVGPEREFDRPRCAHAVNRKAGAVGAALTHNLEHLRGQRSQLGRQRLVFQEKPDNAAHYKSPVLQPQQ